MGRRSAPSYLPAVLSLGILCQIAQIVFLRELLMVFHGNELSLGIILAAWMVWVGVGSRAGARLIERSKQPVPIFAATVAAVPVVLTASVFLIRILRGFFPTPPGAYLSVLDMAVSCFLVMAPACLLFGVQFVLLARLWRERDGSRDTSGAGKTYIGEAAGNVIGAILFTLLLVRFLNPFQALILAGALMLGAVLGLTRNGLPKLHKALVGLFIASVASFPLLGSLDAWTYGLQWKLFLPEHRLVETRQSKYGAISVAQKEDQYSFFQSGHLVFSTAGPGASFADFEEQEGVVFAHFSMVQHPDPKRVLLIGGGLRGTLREIARHPVESIDYIELDRALTEAARPYVSQATIDTLDSPRVRLLHGDGRLHVKGSGSTYDLILVDVPDPATAVLNRFYTEEFFREAARRLHPGGVFVIGAMSTADMRGSAVTNRNAAIYHTLKRVFPHVLPAGERFLFFFASNAPDRISAEARTLQERYRERNIQAPGFSQGHFRVLLHEEPLRRINWIIRHHGRSPAAHLNPPDTGPLFPGSIAEQEIEETRLPPPDRRTFVNSDFKPIGYYYTLLFWNVLSRGNQGDLLSWIGRVRSWWIAPLVLASLLTVLFMRFAGRKQTGRADTRFAVLLSVFTTGLSTMALLIAMLFSFQSLYGFVYEMVGLIVGIFMAGLAMGAAATHRFVADKSNLRVLALFQVLLALFAGLMAVLLPLSAALENPALVFLVISALTLAAGLLNGADFPLATACCLALSKRPESATGTVYGVELFGACAGAMAASVVVAPVLGIAAVCLLASIGNGAAFLGLLFSRRSYG